MRWNWQQPDWPDFTYKPSDLRGQEDRFLKGAGVVIGTMAHLEPQDREQLTITMIAQEAVDSSAIEGEILDRASVQSSIARHLGIKADARRANAAEAGAAELMADLYRTYAEPLSDAMLGHWHAMLMNGRRDLRKIGSYRTHADPMQIVSGAIHAPKVHFEAPPSQRVPDEMARLIVWFNATGPAGSTPAGALLRAGLVHLWFESIHPFEDGNGRLGRALAEKALAQSLDAPAITALAETIQRHRKAYYEQLQRASRSNEVDAWLAWFADIALAAQERSREHVTFLIAKTRLLDRVRGKINDRQEKALLRMFAEGPDGFKGGLSAANYRTITDTLSATATRDLAELVSLGVLRKEGELRYTRYHLLVGG
ncbi:Fic family protein [Novosphingobium mangrovi (ex Huang et al. 2023)]|uniref:Fic family protein n=1 Tax=Novosphingobium mangrovi (ex Huang et al. 2023) TaxID=2976432 RepID=A0ABT2I6J0_9SPHN|nr:Fic family protein [Novosphingobium mangrovi (ex Huang et al. 2023)]MCT2400429.1 Fic family protein [Novosphingobium mangrovi (ex Huang et al. 2023)]